MSGSLDTAAATARLDAARGRRHAVVFARAADFPLQGWRIEGWALGALLWLALAGVRAAAASPPFEDG